MSDVDSGSPTRPPNTLPDSDAELANVEVTTVAPLGDLSFLDRYVLGEELGKGGMGEVVWCRDVRLGRRIALKALHAEVARQGAARSRFLRECQVQAQLEHPAVVPVYDIGQTHEGREYFTMKRVRGQTLAEVIELLKSGSTDERLSRRRLLAAFARICLAIDYAHARGVVHRDLKPANLMLGDFGEVYVLDWGLAKLTGATDLTGESVVGVDTGEQLTMQGSMFGTPGYIAPERLDGDPDDARSDVFSLGAILFELLTLAPLIPRGDALAMATTTLTAIDARASVRAPDRDVPTELEALCIQATMRQPHERLQSARHVADAIERYLDGAREVEQRRSFAELHTRAAAAAARDALAPSGDIEDRRRAMREAGRALAFDPGSTDALNTVVELLVTPPSETPPEVVQSLSVARERNVEWTLYFGRFAFFGMLPMLAFIVWSGIREWPTFVAGAAVMATIGSLMAYAYRVPRLRMGVLLACAVLHCCLILIVTRLFGSLLFVTILAGASLVPPLRLGYRSVTLVVAIGSVLAIVTPLVLETLGAIAPAYKFVDGMMIVLPRGMTFDATATSLFLLVSNLAAIVIVTLTIGATYRRNADLERQLHTQSWQLRQLMPETAARHATPLPA